MIFLSLIFYYFRFFNCKSLPFLFLYERNFRKLDLYYSRLVIMVTNQLCLTKILIVQWWFHRHFLIL